MLTWACAERGCLVDALVNNAMLLLKSFSKIIKTLHKVPNKTKYDLPSTYTVVPMLENSLYTAAIQNDANVFMPIYVYS